jgi:Zn-dependent protease with chaperone function
MYARPQALFASMLIASCVSATEVPATVQRPSADVYAAPSFDAPRLTTLQHNAVVRVSAQQGLWYQLLMPAGPPGFVRVNDVRLAYASAEDGTANVRVLMEGKAGKGRVTETAGVRGIDESDLKAATFNQAQLDAMTGYRVDTAAAAVYAREHGLQATSVTYAGEAKVAERGAATVGSAAPAGVALAKSVGGLLGALGSSAGAKLGGAKLDNASRLAGKSEKELAAEELALGPQITGRILGARPLWNDASAERRVNLVGRWVASQTSRPDLPWTFGVIDTPEVNAFAAPGGYILLTRGLYELLASDAELAAVLGHEMSHCVQRDHYNVIRKQELAAAGKDAALNEVSVGNESAAASFARRYVEKNGATIVLTSFDRDVEYRSDEAAEVYVARAGMNPLALYAVLQKMMALGSDSASLAQLYKTHPPLDARLDRIDQRGFGALETYTTRE